MALRPWWTRAVVQVVRKPDESGRAVVQRTWLPHGPASSVGWRSEEGAWRTLTAEELATALAALRVPDGIIAEQVHALAHDWSRGLWWAAEGAVLHEGGAAGTGPHYPIEATTIVPSPDGHRVYVATASHTVVEIERGSGELRTVAQFAAPIITMCRTPAGLAVWDGDTLAGINVRTAMSARIAQLTLPDMVALAADHRGNFTLASASEVWECRADASGLVRAHANSHS